MWNMSFLQEEKQITTAQRYVHIVCGAIFWAFSFTYLFFYQADVLAAGQHVLSNGQTHYNDFSGAVLITLALHILQLTVARFTKVSEWAHALTFFPSLLALTVVTDVSSNINKGFSFGGWYVALPLLLTLFAALVWGLGKMEPSDTSTASNGLLSRNMWINIFSLVAMFFAVGIFSNGDEAFHYRMRMERLICNGKYNKALKVGRRSTVQDTTLTKIRAFALSKKEQLGEHFFEYPFATGHLPTVLPDTNNLNVIFLPDSVISQHVRYNKVKLQYRLTDLLVQKKIGDFAKLALKAYPDSVMPKHYNEAMAIWKMQHAKNIPDSLLSYTEKEYKDFVIFINKEPKPTPLEIRRKYKKTYWYYFFYGKTQ